MGDPKKARKRYSTPRHPWIKDRIVEEKALTKEYGLKNKREVWKMRSVVEKATGQAKKLISDATEQGGKETQQLLQRLTRYSIVQEGATLNDVLGLQVTGILERRLQTQLVRKSYAKSMKQARQFITHRHVEVQGKKITFPSYLVTKEDEPGIVFSPRSSLADEDHPERRKELSAAEKEVLAKKKDKAKAKEKAEEEKKAATETEKPAVETKKEPVKVKEEKKEEKKEDKQTQKKEEKPEKPAVETKKEPAKEKEEKSEKAPTKEDKKEQTTEESKSPEKKQEAMPTKANEET